MQTIPRRALIALWLGSALAAASACDAEELGFRAPTLLDHVRK
jgi:hypothetical protein